MGREEILLKEYEVCQQDNNSIASRYWFVVGIFMAINAAVLGGLTYGFITSDILSKILFRGNITGNDLPQVLVLGLPVVILGAGIITILLFLMRWRKRVDFIIHFNHDRMHEIETELGIWKSLRVHVLDDLDNWNEMSHEERDKLTHYHSEQWWQSWRSSRRYERPRGRESVTGIFYTLILLWGIFIVTALVAIVRALIISNV